MLTVDVNEIESYKGKEMGHSEWMTIDQERINQFAEATSDHQWIHVDEEKAQKELPTKSTIAHGFLSLSLSVPLSAQVWIISGAKMVINYCLSHGNEKYDYVYSVLPYENYRIWGATAGMLINLYQILK